MPRQDIHLARFNKPRSDFTLFATLVHYALVIATWGLMYLLEREKVDSHYVLPVLSLLAIVVQGILFSIKAAKLELASGPRQIAVGAWLIATALPCVPFVLGAEKAAAVLSMCLGTCCLIFVMSLLDQQPPMRAEVEKELQKCEEEAAACRVLLTTRPEPVPNTAPVPPKPAVAPPKQPDPTEKARNVRDERLAELVAASRDPDNPLPAMTVAAQLQAIHADYEQEIERTQP